MAIRLSDLFPIGGSRPPHLVRRPEAAPRQAGRGRAAARRPKALQFEALEPRILLSGDAIPTGYTAALGTGLAALGAAIEQQLGDDLFANAHVPGILIRGGTADNPTEFSPTLGEAMTLDVDVTTTDLPYADPNGVLAPPAGATLAERYAFVSADSILPEAQALEARLRAIDLDQDGRAELGEAFQVLVGGQIRDYLDHNDIADVDEDGPVEPEDLGAQLRSFLAGTLGADEPAFGIPEALDAQFDLVVNLAPTFDYNSDSGVLLWNIDASLSMFSPERLDLGYEADQLNIALAPTAPGVPPSPKTVQVARTLDLNSFQFGLRSADDGAVTNGDFFFALPQGFTAGVAYDTPDVGAGSLPGTKINIGFLGAVISSGDIRLDMQVLGTASDPSNPAALGFSAVQGVLQANGTLLADAAPQLVLPATGIEFSLAIGTSGKPVVVQLAGGTYASLAALATALDAAIDTALGPANLVDVAVVGDKLQLDMVADPSANMAASLGFDAGQLGTTVLVAANASALIGQLPPADPASFWLSVNGAGPTLITVTITGAANGPDGTAGNADDGQVTAESLRQSLQLALDNASTGLTATLNAGKLQIGGAVQTTLEIPVALTLANVDQITATELQSEDNEIFALQADPDAAFLLDLNFMASAGLELEGTTDAYQPSGRIYADAKPFSSQISTVTVDAGALRRVSFSLLDKPLADGGKTLLSGESELRPMLDFNVIGAADILGIVNQVANFLDRLAASELLQPFDIPFAQKTLGELLGLKDLVIDSLLLNDGDDGQTKPNNDGSNPNGKIADGTRLMGWLPTGNPLNSEYALRPLISTAQDLEARLANMFFDMGLYPLLPAAFTGVDASVRQYDQDGKPRQDLLYALNFEHALTPAGQPIEVPLDFALNLAPLGGFETEGAVALSADGAMGFTLGIKLGNAASALNLANAAGTTPTHLIDDLNSGSGVKVNSNPALTSLGVIQPQVGRLSADASFTITLYSGAGNTPSTHVVTLGQALTSDNLSLAHLVADLNTALGSASNGGLAGKIEAASLSELVGDTLTERIVLRAVDGNIGAFELGVATSSTAYTELGLQTQRAATVSVLAPGAVLNVDPTGSASFQLDVVRTDGTLVPVFGITVGASALNGNVALASLVTDINEALATALVANGLQADSIVASQSGGRLAFSAIRGDIRGFSVTPGDNDEALGLTLPDAAASPLTAGVLLRAGAAPANSFGRLAADLDFTLNGTALQITADSTATNSTVADLVAQLNAAIGGSGLAGQLRAQLDGGRIVLRATSPSVAAITIAGLSGGERSALGFADNASTLAISGQPALMVVGSQNAPLSYGVRSATTLTFNVTGGASAGSYDVTLTPQGTVLNRSVFDLAASLNNGLNNTFAAAGKANPLVATVQAGQLVLGLRTAAVGSNLIGNPAGAAVGVSTFGVSASGAGAAAQDLLLVPVGVGTQSRNASNADLGILFSDGSTAGIVLESIPGIGLDAQKRLTGDLKTLVDGIVAAAGGRLGIELGSDGSSLRLVDNTFVDGGPNNAEFQVSLVNGSPAALQLGLLGKDSTRLNATGTPAQNAPLDGRIEGSRIATVDLLDRVYLRDASLTGHLELATVGVATATATFGFVGVQLASSDNQTLFEAELAVPFLNAGSDVVLGDLFGALGRTADLRGLIGLPTLSTSSDFDLTVSVTPAIEGLATALDVPALATISFDIQNLGTLEDYDKALQGGGTIPSVRLVAPSVDVDFDVGGLTGIGDLASFQDISFQGVIDALKLVSGILNTFAAFDFLGDDIPVLGLSVNELIGVADSFAQAVADVEKDPSGGLQSLAQKLREGFGLPDFLDDAARDAFFASLGIPDPSDLIAFAFDTGNVLRFDLRLPVGFSRGLSVDLDLGEILGASLGPVALQGGAGLAASGYLDARLSFGIDLADPTQVVVYDDVSGIFGGLNASADKLFFNAAIGPLGVFVRDGRVDLGLAFSAANDPDGAANDGSRVPIGDFIAGLAPTLTGEVQATLPVFFPTDSLFLGDIVLDISSATTALTLSGAGLQLPDFSAPGVLTLPDFSAIDLSALNVFDSIPLMLDGLDFFLQGLQDILDGQIGGLDLPLIGDQLAGGADFIEDLRQSVLAPIRLYVEQAPELGLEFVQALLYELLGDDGAQGTVAGQSIESVLGVAGDIDGLGLLKDYSTGAGAPTQDDIVATIDGDDVVWKFRLGQTYTPTINFGFDIGIPALSLQADVGLDVTIDWDLAIGLGLSLGDGPYVFIGNHRSAATDDDEELTVSIDVALQDDSGIEGTLGFLQLIIAASTTNDALLEVDSTFVSADFSIDLVNKADANDQKLSFSELGNLDAEVALSAEAEVNLDLTAQVDPSLVPDAVAAVLPAVSARFILDWETGDVIGGDADFADSLKTLGFRSVAIDMGSFINDFIGPFVSKVAEVTEPLQPIIDVITAPIPVISDLAGQPISLIDIAGMTGYVEPALIYAVADIITLVNKIGDASSNGAISIPIGDFILIGGDNAIAGFDADKLLSSGYSFDEDFDANRLKADFGALAGDVLGALDGLGGLSAEQQKTKEITQSLSGPSASLSGFAFPLFDDPALIFGLFLGQDVPLVTYDLAPFGMDFSYVQKFPIWGPLFARIGGGVGLTIDLAFGYDTYGVRQFAAGDFSNPLDLLGGLYVSDTDSPNGTGTDVPELILRGELFAGAEINLGIGSAGVEGAIILTVNFDLYDPDSDGRVRVDELLGNFLYEFNYGSPALAPIAIFDVFGDVSAQLRAFIELLFFERTFNITPPITLVEFSIPFERQPFLATERGDGSLLLNIGPNAGARLNGDTRDISETVFVKSVDGSNNEVLVWNGSTVRESDAQRYRLGENKLILGDGGAGNDVVNLAGVSAASGIRYDIQGSDGDDEIHGTQAGGQMDGGLGNDELQGGEGIDLVRGGDGNDVIRGGAGADTLFGDSGSLSQFTLNAESLNRLRSVVGEKDGDDDIDAGAGNDIVFGGGGRDLIRGGADDDLIFGDGGSFDMASGNVLPTSAGRVDLSRMTARGAGAADTLYGDGGDDTMLGGAGDDSIDGGAGSDQADGGIGFDVVHGGSGADWLFGGDNDDIVFGFRDPQGAVFGFAGDTADNDADGDDQIQGGEGNDFLRGQDGSDTLHGGRGADILFGDAGDDVLVGEAGSDLVFGGASNDFIEAGAGGDIVFGDDGLVAYIDFHDAAVTAFTATGSRIRTDATGKHRLIGDGPEAWLGDYASRDDGIATSMDLAVTVSLASDGGDNIAGGTDNDTVFGGGGNDFIFGDYNPATGFSGPRPAGQDILVGDGGRIEMFGRRNAAAMAESGAFDGNDQASGNDGSDHILAGGGSDTVWGFRDPALAVPPASNDSASLPGVPDNDIIVGDNGVIRFDTLDARNRVMSVTTTVVVDDSGRSDMLAGNQGNDILLGGLNSSSDILDGNAGDDILIGDNGEVRFDLTPDLDVLDLVRSFADSLGGDDSIHGQAGNDIAIGGTGGDAIDGDGGDDILLGDNGRITLAAGPGRLLVQVAAMPAPSAVETITTTDLAEATGGVDTISGNAGGDIVFGGVAGDLLHGDAAVPVYALDGADVIVGDNGGMDFTLDGDLNTLNLVESATDGLGGDDSISGHAGGDVAIGGSGADQIFGDSLADAGGVADGDDILLGDNAELLLRKLAAGEVAQLSVLDAGVRLIQTTDAETLPYWNAVFNTTWSDNIAGQGGSDVIIGGLAADVLDGAAPVPNYSHDRADVLIGDNGLLNFDVDADLGVLNLVRSQRDGLGGDDQIHGHRGGDLAIGGTGADQIDGDNPAAAGAALDGDDILLGDNGDVVLRKRGAGETAQIVVRGGGVQVITTTDTVDNKSWSDTVSGQAGRDIVIGGVAGDTLYGDAASPVNALDGDDILLGDNGRLDFDLDPVSGNLNSLDRMASVLDALGDSDVISGNAGADVALGGTAGDVVHGDNAAAAAGVLDRNDILLGDNGVIDLVTAPLAAPTAQGIRIYGGAVKAIHSTDDGVGPLDADATAGSDLVEGNAGGDILLGGSLGDRLHGDRVVVTLASNPLDGADTILGDNGRLEWLSTGRLGDISGIDLQATNLDLWTQYQAGVADGNVDTLDLVTTEQPNNGGRDLVHGDNGSDVAFGGTDTDLVFGDSGPADAWLSGPLTANDLVFGDHGRLYPQFSRALVGSTLTPLSGIHGRNFFAIHIGAGQGGDGDILFGEEGDDILLGQQGDDRMFGGSNDDDMVGGHNVAGGVDELAGTAFGAVSVSGAWDIDLVGIDLARGGAWNDLMDGGSGNDAMSGDNTTLWRRGDTLSARFRAVDGSVLYSSGYDTVTVNVQGRANLANSAFWKPELGAAVGRDITLLDHDDTVQNTPNGRFGNDVMAGGAHQDTLFGQLGDDLMQGDGELGAVANLSKGLFSVADTGVIPAVWPPIGAAFHFNVPEQASDGDDALEGNGGNDIQYGGLGQDDMVGGSSSLHGLTTRAQRPDGADIQFGGAGNPARLALDAGFDGTEAGSDGLDRARDADTLAGDNANILRIVNAAGTAYLRHTYDTVAYSGGIVVRGMDWLDYTLGGPDYDAAAQADDRGAGDWQHGESGNDALHGMAGSDVLFGGAHDDDLTGGYGHDWISGGTGQDGVVGDDGLILTSRNGLTETLIGLGTANLQQDIKTPGSIQTATIYPTGQLLKTVDLTPISVDPAWGAQDDEFGYGAAQGGIPYADDIIYGGLGSDFLHGGSGDDAISGAEALRFFYESALVTMPGVTIAGLPPALGVVGGVALGEDTLTTGGSAIGAGLWVNPGDVLRFNPVDEVAWKTQNRQRAGEFALYDEYNPLRTIRVTGVDGWGGDLAWAASGVFDASAGFDFLLNFDPSKGVLRPGYEITVNGNKKLLVPAVNDDGNDAIFGGNGNDWLVGGTGQDASYGGWGNDLLNADDDHRSHGSLNDEPDTHVRYEDRAYGGAGRDVLIGNTGGDRLIDWVGEFNSYLVPFAPFGMATVSRTLQPQLPEFLYALSRSQGADATIVADGNGTAIRNGEPHGELGLVLQKDFAWQDQTGAPADPQAGNIPGGKRDVLRSADFNDAQTQGFVPESGSWTLVQGKYQVAPASGSNKDAISLFYVDEFVPSYFEVQATINAVKPTGGQKANAYVVFDYQSTTNFKFAGINVSTNKYEIGQRSASGWQVLATGVATGSLKADTDYNLLLALNGSLATVVVNNVQVVSHAFAPRVDSSGVAHGLNAYHAGRCGRFASEHV